METTKPLCNAATTYIPSKAQRRTYHDTSKTSAEKEAKKRKKEHEKKRKKEKIKKAQEQNKRRRKPKEVPDYKNLGAIIAEGIKQHLQ